jgi:hypothetical protein
MHGRCEDVELKPAMCGRSGDARAKPESHKDAAEGKRQGWREGPLTCGHGENTPK